MRMRAKYYREFFEGNSRKFSKIENENEGKISESFGIPSINYMKVQTLLQQILVFGMYTQEPLKYMDG